MILPGTRLAGSEAHAGVSRAPGRDERDRSIAPADANHGAPDEEARGNGTDDQEDFSDVQLPWFVHFVQEYGHFGKNDHHKVILAGSAER